MIRVIVSKSNDVINKIVVTGHAEYDNTGKDLVCAGVSSIIFGGMNALDAIDNNQLEFEVLKNKVSVIVLSYNEDIQKLLKMLIIQLETIENSYKEHIKIKMEV